MCLVDGGDITNPDAHGIPRGQLREPSAGCTAVYFMTYKLYLLDLSKLTLTKSNKWLKNVPAKELKMTDNVNN